MYPEALIPAEEIARHYAACLDSVALINGEKPQYTSDEDWEQTVQINKEHLIQMLAKDYWTDEDLTPLKEAIK
jgi:hypothetical protein